MFKIGEFSRLSGLSADALYHYEKKGILVPAEVDRFTGYRGYDASQLVTVNRLMALKDAGFSLDEIADILKSEPKPSALLKMLEAKAEALEDGINRDIDRLERLRTNLFLIRNGGIPLVNEFAIKRVEPILAASVRKSFAKDMFDSELKAMWGEVNAYIDGKGGKRCVPCMMIYHAGWHDLAKWTDTGKDDKLDVEVVEPVAKAFESGETVRVYSLPAVERMACAVHNGPFSSIGATCESLYAWIKQNGYTPEGTEREIYHKGDWMTDNPDEYVTEIQIPLK